MVGHTSRGALGSLKARIAAMAAVMAVLLAGCATDDDAAADSTTTTVGLFKSGVWIRVDRDELVFGGYGDQSMEAVTAGGPGLVAVGYELVDGDSDAAVWTSADGLVWTRVLHYGAGLGGDGDQRMFGVTAGGPGLIAVGGDDHSAAVWASPDGLTWSRVPHDEALSGGLMRSVTVGGPGLVAVGNDLYGGGAAVWTSSDGVTWSRVPHDETVFGGDRKQIMFSVVAGGPGLVAVGYDSSVGLAAVWISPDGLTWTRIPHDDEVFGGDWGTRIFSVTSGGPGLIAVGSADVFPEESEGIAASTASLRDAAVWASSDGITWARVSHNEAVFGGEYAQEMMAAVSFGEGVVAIGEDESGGYVDAAVWTSPDGLIWTRVPNENMVFGGRDSIERLAAIVTGGPGLVAVGSDHSLDDSGSDAAVWVFSRS